MFVINLIPQRSDEELMVSRNGWVLTINGVDFDFEPMPNGAFLPADALDCDFIISEVEKADGKIYLSMRLPYGPIPHPPPPEAHAVLFPTPITVNTNGPVALPIYAPNEVEE